MIRKLNDNLQEISILKEERKNSVDHAHTHIPMVALQQARIKIENDYENAVKCISYPVKISSNGREEVFAAPENGLCAVTVKCRDIGATPWEVVSL